MSVSSAVVTPGQTITLAGERLHEGCDDGSGEHETALNEMPVLFWQGSEPIELTRADADPDTFTVSIDVTVPVDASSGPAAFAFRGGDCPPATSIIITAAGPVVGPPDPGLNCGNWPAN